jgi:hypothetical protein
MQKRLAQAQAALTAGADNAAELRDQVEAYQEILQLLD